MNCAGQVSLHRRRPSVSYREGLHKAHRQDFQLRGKTACDLKNREKY